MPTKLAPLPSSIKYITALSIRNSTSTLVNNYHSLLPSTTTVWIPQILSSQGLKTVELFYFYPTLAPPPPFRSTYPPQPAPEASPTSPSTTSSLSYCHLPNLCLKTWLPGTGQQLTMEGGYAVQAQIASQIVIALGTALGGVIEARGGLRGLQTWWRFVQGMPRLAAGGFPPAMCSNVKILRQLRWRNVEMLKT